MRLKEFNVVDLAERAYFELHKILESNNLLENNTNNKQYSEFIDLEKQQTVGISQLNSVDDYYPLYLNSAPVAEYIRGEYLDNPAKFVTINDNKCIFATQNTKTIKFPIDKNAGDARIDLFVFDTRQNLDHFLLELNIKFSEWNIEIRAINL